MSSDFYNLNILPFSGIIIKICRAYTNNQKDFEDYYQEVCLQIWRSHSNFREQSQQSTWLYKLTLNVCLTLLKKDKRSKFISNSISTDLIDDCNSFTDESLNLLYDAIKQLTEVDRAIILLYLEEKTYKEIAEIIGSNPNNIGVRIIRIKEKLKKLLDGKIY